MLRSKEAYVGRLRVNKLDFVVVSYLAHFTRPTNSSFFPEVEQHLSGFHFGLAIARLDIAFQVICDGPLHALSHSVKQHLLF